jgi:hypothetical protein
MYGEGTVIFTDHRLYDDRVAESNRWDKTVNLINPDSAEPTGSTLLSLFNPMHNDTSTHIFGSPSPAEIATNIVDNWEGIYEMIGRISSDLKRKKFSVASLRKQLVFTCKTKR